MLSRYAVATIVFALHCISAWTVVAQPAAHPLDPLTAAEIETAAQVLGAHRDLPKGALFPTIALREPPKDTVLRFRAGNPIRREAFVTVLDREGGRTFEAVVDLQAKQVNAWHHIPGAQPLITLEELTIVPSIVRADARWQAAMKKRGVTNLDDVMIDPWAPGPLSASEAPSTRWIRALSYMKGDKKNGYARPIEGVVAVVNMNRKQVDRVMDLGVYPIPPEAADLDEKSVGPLRTPPKPLTVTQPEGPTYEVNGQEVRWQKWRFRFAVHPREGLVLYTVGYEDQGKIRPILYRASLSEMVVPYADPAGNWSFRNAFDEGEYGIGRLTDALEIGTDAPPYATFFDVTYADDVGKPVVQPRGVALYERDGGLLWKHFEFYSNSNDSRRARELHLLSIVTVGNYDYGFVWIFRQDGSLELQALASGIMLPKGVAMTKVEHSSSIPRRSGPLAANASPPEGRFWHLVAPNVAAVHHQHFFNFRIDLDVDGETPNRVSELNVKSVPAGRDNPALNAFTMEATPLADERSAQRDMSLEHSRKWLVTNSSATNALGHHTGYLLVPGDNSVPYLQPGSSVRKRAGFIDHHFWATAYDEDEMHGAGEYPNQGRPGQGLPAWTAGNRSLAGKDVVIWYTFGLTHIPRPEEWPVMSATTLGFKLLPVGFFAKNPSLDVPK